VTREACSPQLSVMVLGLRHEGLVALTSRRAASSVWGQHSDAQSAIAVDANGLWSIESDLRPGDGYNISVSRQPPLQLCLFNPASADAAPSAAAVGTLVAENVQLQLECYSYVQVSVRVVSSSAQVAAGVAAPVFILNSKETLSLLDGVATFPTPLQSGTKFNITVLSVPTGHSCRLSGSAIGLVDLEMPKVSLVCTSLYSSATSTPELDYYDYDDVPPSDVVPAFFFFAVAAMCSVTCWYQRLRRQHQQRGGGVRVLDPPAAVAVPVATPMVATPMVLQGTVVGRNTGGGAVMERESL